MNSTLPFVLSEVSEAKTRKALKRNSGPHPPFALSLPRRPRRRVNGLPYKFIHGPSRCTMLRPVRSTRPSGPNVTVNSISVVGGST